MVIFHTYVNVYQRVYPLVSAHLFEALYTVKLSLAAPSLSIGNMSREAQKISGVFLLSRGIVVCIAANTGIFWC
jgi:hypothetical protein